MDVKNRLSSIWTGIDDRSVTGLLYSTLKSKLLGDKGEVTQQHLIFCSHVVEGLDVSLGDNQQMHWRFRVNILKRKAVIVFENNFRRHFFFGDPAENAGRHRSSPLQ
jgi:hypothetical protein